MKRYIGFDSQGVAYIDTTTNCAPVENGVTFVEVRLTDKIDVNSQYWNGTEFVDKGTKPSEFHEFKYATKQWVLNVEWAWAGIKYKRSQLLTACDWVVTKAAETGQPVPPEWAIYRQTLRNIPLQVDPIAIVWPIAP